LRTKARRNRLTSVLGILVNRVNLVPGLETLLAGHLGHKRGGVYNTVPMEVKTTPRIGTLDVSLLPV
jgi:hypothetical protein